MEHVNVLSRPPHAPRASEKIFGANIYKPGTVPEGCQYAQVCSGGALERSSIVTLVMARMGSKIRSPSESRVGGQELLGCFALVLVYLQLGSDRGVQD